MRSLSSGEKGWNLTSQVVQSEDGILSEFLCQPHPERPRIAFLSFFLRAKTRGELLTAWAWVRMRASICRSCFLGHHSTAPE